MSGLRRGRRLVKKLAWSVLPAPAVQAIRRRHYLNSVRTSGPRTEPDLTVVAHLVNDGDTVVDIGANVGVYTHPLSRMVGPRGRVYSFEPFPATFDLLQYNVAQLALDNVELFNVALSDRETVVTMGTPQDRSGAETHYRAHIMNGPDHTAADSQGGIRATTLDSVLTGAGPDITFVKCDVEGHELACLRGGAGFLAATGAAWLIEVSGNPDADGSPARQVFALLEDRGYSAWWFDGRFLVRRRRGDESVNYFFLLEDHCMALAGTELELRG